MPRYLRIYVAVAAFALLAAVHYYLPPFHRSGPPSPGAEPYFASSPSSSVFDGEDGQRTDSSGVVVDKKGLMSYSPGHARHPVEMLIEKGKKLAEEMEHRIASVKSVRDSAKDYLLAFGMRPPRGFDAWYAYTQSVPAPHPPSLPSLIPLVHKPMLPFLSHPAALLRTRVEKLRDADGSIFTLTFVPDGQGDRGTACAANGEWHVKDWHVRDKGMVLVRGAAAWSWRCNNTLSLLLPLLPLMPEEMSNQNPPLELAFSVDDGPRGMVHNTFRERSEALARSGRYLVLNDMTDIVSANAESQHVAGDKTFIADFDKSIDYCMNPDLMSLHHILLSEQHRAAVNLVPALVTCRAYPLTVSTRGTATGLSHDKLSAWRQSQRERLHWFGNNMTGTVPLLLPDGSIKHWDRADLVDKWLDVGLSGGPTQCNVEDGTCDAMAKEIDFKDRVSKEDGIKYKYVIDVDGNGWSSRFRRLLQGNNVVFKSTLYDMLIPWYHYVPTKLDYSDILEMEGRGYEVFHVPPHFRGKRLRIKDDEI
ncbi:hypothetical protein I310_01732 [Cryptococcus deuterogattii CA1014]|nr:hypothetical protein I310_01732 [Cryptococcus deuterogattii CA1014]